MNKLERTNLKLKKFKRRLKMYNLWEKGKGLLKHHEFRNSSKPCSCWMCRNEKFSRKIKHK